MVAVIKKGMRAMYQGISGCNGGMPPDERGMVTFLMDDGCAVSVPQAELTIVDACPSDCDACHILRVLYRDDFKWRL